MKAKIIEIGKDAIQTDENLLIFFDDTATGKIREVSVIQAFEEEDYKELNIGDKIIFGDISYTIQTIGSLANQQLQEIGHVTLFFGETPTDEMMNAIGFMESKLPKLYVGMEIVYQTA